MCDIEVNDQRKHEVRNVYVCLRFSQALQSCGWEGNSSG